MTAFRVEITDGEDFSGRDMGRFLDAADYVRRQQEIAVAKGDEIAKKTKINVILDGRPLIQYFYITSNATTTGAGQWVQGTPTARR